jgi:hypothetical protein
VQAAVALEALVSAAFILIGSKLGDLFGRKRAYVTGLVFYVSGAVAMVFAQGWRRSSSSGRSWADSAPRSTCGEDAFDPLLCGVGRGGVDGARTWRGGGAAGVEGAAREDRAAGGVSSSQRGQISKSEHSGLWVIRYRDAFGRRPQKTGYRTQGEARDEECGVCDRCRKLLTSTRVEHRRIHDLRHT